MERGSRKEWWFSERNCSGAWKCLFFNCVSVGIYRLTLSWCKSVLPLHCSWFMAPEDLAPYFLLWACLPKANFFTTFFLLVNETTGWKQQTMLSQPLRWTVLWKNPFAGGQSCGLLGQPCYSRWRSCPPREEFSPKGLNLVSSVLGTAAAWSTHDQCDLGIQRNGKCRITTGYLMNFLWHWAAWLCGNMRHGSYTQDQFGSQAILTFTSTS